MHLILALNGDGHLDPILFDILQNSNPTDDRIRVDTRPELLYYPEDASVMSTSHAEVGHIDIIARD